MELPCYHVARHSLFEIIEIFWLERTFRSQWPLSADMPAEIHRLSSAELCSCGPLQPCGDHKALTAAYGGSSEGETRQNALKGYRCWWAQGTEVNATVTLKLFSFFLRHTNTMTSCILPGRFGKEDQLFGRFTQPV